MPGNALLVQGTAISSVAPLSDWYRTTYQLQDGTLQQRNLQKDLTNIKVSPPAAASSPLATISWDGGNEIRIYYLDNSNYIREAYRSEGKWKSRAVTVGKSPVQAAPSAGLAATVARVEETFQARLYYQRVDGKILELIGNKGVDDWFRGTLEITDAISDTSLAAAAFISQNKTFYSYVFYQTKSLSLKDYSFDGKRWSEGTFGTEDSVVPARTAIAALAFYNNTDQLDHVQIYWHSLDGTIKFARMDGSNWHSPEPTNIAANGYKFSVIQWSEGARLRLFYQELLGPIVLHQSDDGGKNWTKAPSNVAG